MPEIPTEAYMCHHVFFIFVNFSYIKFDFFKIKIDFPKIKVDFSKIKINFSKIKVDFSKNINKTCIRFHNNQQVCHVERYKEEPHGIRVSNHITVSIELMK